jgi:His-Xaa-Ser system protein HxsD
LKLEFHNKAFSLLAVQKACHRLSNKASFNIRPLAEDIEVLIESKPGTTPELLASELRTEVLDQQMRETVRAETMGVRNLILAHAFSRTGLIHPDGHAPSGVPNE